MDIREVLNKYAEIEAIKIEAKGMEIATKLAIHNREEQLPYDEDYFKRLADRIRDIGSLPM